MSVSPSFPPAPSIRSATERDLAWLCASPDPRRLAVIKAAEIESAITATATPSHRRPIEIDEAQMR